MSSVTAASSEFSLKSAVLRIFESSSVERAIVSSPSSPEKKPVSSFEESSSITGSSTAISSEIIPCDSLAAGAGAAFISSRLFLRVLISSLRFERSATICCKSELSTLDVDG